MFTNKHNLVAVEPNNVSITPLTDEFLKEREKVNDLWNHCMKIVQGDVFTKLYDRWGRMTARLFPVEVPSRTILPAFVPEEGIDRIPHFMLEQINNMRARLIFVPADDEESCDAYQKFIETAKEFTARAHQEFMLMNNIRDYITNEVSAGGERALAVENRIMSSDFTLEKMRETVKTGDDAFESNVQRYNENRKKWSEYFIMNGLGPVLNNLSDFLCDIVRMRVEPIWIHEARRITEGGEQDMYDRFISKTVHGTENPLRRLLPRDPSVRFARDGEDQEGMRIIYRPAYIVPEEEKGDVSVGINPEGTGVRVTFPFEDEPDAAIYTANIQVRLNDNKWVDVGNFSLHLYQSGYTLRLEGVHRIFYNKIDNPYLFADPERFAQAMADEFADITFPDEMEE